MISKNEIIYKVWEVLEYEIRGKPVYKWFLYILEFSFLIWIPLAIWIGYSMYKELNKLEYSLQEKHRLLQHEYAKIKRLKQKIGDINEAYKALATFFNPEELQKLKKNINAYVFNLQRISKVGLIKTPILYKTFNYPLHIPPPPVESQTLPDINFSSKSVQDFVEAFRTFNRKYKDLKPIRGNVKISIEGKSLILTFKRKRNGLLELKPVRYLGFISNMKYLEDIPTIASIPPEAKQFRTNVFIGWILQIVNKNKGGFKQ